MQQKNAPVADISAAENITESDSANDHSAKLFAQIFSKDLPADKTDYWENYVAVEANKVDPALHTMDEQHFAEYIGRFRYHGGDLAISGKKFTKDQKAVLADAYRAQIPVHVFGLPAAHFDRFKIRLGCQAVVKATKHIQATHKKFNCKRSDFYLVETKPVKVDVPQANERMDAPKRQELWVFTFPSPEYVEQIAQLIQAIFDDYDQKERHRDLRDEPARNAMPAYPHRVNVHQFRGVSDNISEWTGLRAGLLAFVRHGDVVVIGNVDRILSGLETMLFEAKFETWQKFGDQGMFHVQVLVHSVSHSRIVLLGVEECFWGSASARYVDAALRAGARHILYCSKAGGLHAHDQLHKLRTPQHFAIFSNEKRQRSEGLASAAVLDQAVFRLAAQFEVLASGTNITVPTVIGETQEQRERLEESGLTTVDNEDGHIARVITLFNTEHKFDGAVFFPVHFITDYLRKPNEQAQRGQPHLATEDRTVDGKRDAAFERIGTLFGTYAALYGLREFSLSITGRAPSFSMRSSHDSQKLLDSVSQFVDAGLMREAGNALCGDRPIGGQDPATLVAMGTLCQKHGYVDEAFHINLMLRKQENFERLTISDQFRALLTEVKVASQVGQHNDVSAKFETVLRKYDALTTTERTSVFPQMRSGVHRCLLAAKANNVSYSFNDPKVALFFENHADAKAKDSAHANATTDFFSLISKLREPVVDIPSILLGLSDVRRQMYACHDQNRPVWRADANRSAVTNLFVEASFLLLGNHLEQTRGRARLVTAHILNSRVMGRERSEGLGDLLSYVPDLPTQNLLRRAMRIDGIGRQAFQQTPGVHELLHHAQPILAVLTVAVGERAKCIDDLLATLDRRAENHAHGVA
jgi:hypothetical protein